VFFCFGRLVRCRVGCLFWRGAVRKGAQAPSVLRVNPSFLRTGKSACTTERRRTLACGGGKNWRLCRGVALAQAGMPVLLKPVATIPL
jgi:hypothetical protein